MNCSTSEFEQAIECWSTALDNDQWPTDWENVGEVVDGMSFSTAQCSEPMTVKVTKAMKNAIDVQAEREGITISDAIRQALGDWLMTHATKIS